MEQQDKNLLSGPSVPSLDDFMAFDRSATLEMSDHAMSTCPEEIKLYSKMSTLTKSDLSDLLPILPDNLDSTPPKPHRKDALPSEDDFAEFEEVFKHNAPEVSHVADSESKPKDSDALDFAFGGDDPFASPESDLAFLSITALPSSMATRLDDSDDSEELEERRFQDEGLRKQLRQTLKRELNYSDVDMKKRSSSTPKDLRGGSLAGDRLFMTSFKHLHASVGNRLMLEVFNSATALGSRNVLPIPEEAQRKSQRQSRSSHLGVSIRADEIGCNVFQSRRIRPVNYHVVSEVVDKHSVYNYVDKATDKLDQLDIEGAIEEDMLNKKRIFKRRRVTREITTAKKVQKKHSIVADEKLAANFTLSHLTFRAKDEPLRSFQNPVYTTRPADRIDLSRLQRGDIVFIFDCMTSHSRELAERIAVTVKHVMIVTENYLGNVEVAHVTRTQAEQNFLKIWDDSEERHRASLRDMLLSASPDALLDLSTGFMGVVFRVARPEVTLKDGKVVNLAHEAAAEATRMLGTGRVLPTRLVYKSTCLQDAENQSFLLRNRYSFYRRDIRAIWDKGDDFLNLHPQDFVVLCYQRAIVKAAKSFEKDIIKILDIDWRACNIHDFYTVITENEDWTCPGEILFEFVQIEW